MPMTPLDAALATELPEPVRLAHPVGDSELVLYRWPRPGAPRMLLVHGIGMGHAVYGHFIEEMLPHADITAVDLPGFGDTPEPREALSIEGTADVLADALLSSDPPSPPVIAIGHSMGAQVVAELAVRHPALVTRLVCIAASTNPAERSAAIQGMRMVQDFFESQTPDVFLKGLASYIKTGPRWFIRKLGPMLEHRMERVLPRVTQPALVLRGAQDRICSRGWAVRMTGLLPRGELRQLPGSGHEAIIHEGGPAVREILDWLGRVASGRG